MTETPANLPGAVDLERFRASVLRWLGLYFDESKQDFLADVLRGRADELGVASAAYLAMLEGPARPRQELRTLAQDLTVTETSFFRNPDQIRAFSEVALPDRMAARSAYRRLRILSAGCASGEEAYTLAACTGDCPGLQGRSGPGGWDVSILGIDVNVAMLGKATAARYSSWSLRQTPAELRTRLFRADGSDFLLDASVRDRVSFEERNLVADDTGSAATFWQPGSFDVIFCRNVLMYFAPEVARTVIARMARSLTPGGFLFLGHAETLRGLSSDFHLRHTHETFYYQRKDAPDSLGWAGMASYAASLPNAPLGTPRSDGAWIDRIGHASRRIRSLTDAPRAGTGRAAPKPVRAPLDLGVAVDLLAREQFAEAQSVLNALPSDRAHDPEVLLLTAVLHSHGGNLVLAERVCRELLAVDELNAGAHYLMALCRESDGDDRGAVDHDQIAAYLDPGFAMPRLHLGLLARRGGDRETARRELRQALLLLQREDSAHLLLFGGGFGRKALITLCRAELKACGA